MKLFSAEQIKQWDEATIKAESITSLILMDRAAIKCTSWIIDHYNEFENFCILCGTGNNGGDGLVIARKLVKYNKAVSIYVLQSDNKSSDFIDNIKNNEALSLPIFYINSPEDFPEIKQKTIIIDALFGTGLNRTLADLAATFVDYINNLKRTVISIDIPSGMIADKSSKGNPIIKATHTLSFQIKKLAFLFSENEIYLGDVHILDIGLDKKFYDETTAPFSTLERSDIQLIYKPREKKSHKYNFGHALLYVGSKNMNGAAILCTKSCLRSGVGLATIYTKESFEPIFQITIPEAITSFEHDFGKISYKKSAIGVGPGWENNEENKEILQNIILNFKNTVVIDATALNLLVDCKELITQRENNTTILTPHSGEFERLFGTTEDEFSRLHFAIEQAKKYGCMIVLKGHHTIVICPDGEVFFNTTGNAGMATAGSGDVLTGIITGLIAQGYSAKNACIFGVYLHGIAGDIAAKELSEEAMIAGDICTYIGKAYQNIKQ